MTQLRYDRLQELKSIDARAFNLPIDDERVEHCATIALMIEDHRALVVSGKSVDHQVALSLSAERRLWIKELMPPPKPEPFEVIIVGKDGSRKELEERRKEYVAEMKAKEASAPPVPIAPPPAPSPPPTEASPIAAASCRVS